MVARLQAKTRCKPLGPIELDVWAEELARFDVVDLLAAVRAYSSEWPPKCQDIVKLAKSARYRRLGYALER